MDFAFAVEDWEQYEQLRKGLLEIGSFSPCEDKIHRLFFHDGKGVKFIVDLIPFGKIAEQNRIAWPPTQDVVMNVAGFEEALHSTVAVRIDDGCTLMVASLPGLAILKLMAWKDRSAYTSKDASDFLKILREYADAGNEDRLYDHESELLESVGYDTELAGATILGKDAAQIASEDTKRQIQGLLTAAKEGLIVHMLIASGLPVEHFGQRCVVLLERFTVGFNDSH